MFVHFSLITRSNDLNTETVANFIKLIKINGAITCFVFFEGVGEERNELHN